MYVSQASRGAAQPDSDGPKTQASTTDGAQGKRGAAKTWIDAWRRTQNETRGAGGIAARYCGEGEYISLQSFASALSTHYTLRPFNTI